MSKVKRIHVPKSFKNPAFAYARYREALEEASRLRVIAGQLKRDNMELRRLAIKNRHEKGVVQRARRVLRRMKLLEARNDFQDDLAEEDFQ